MDRSPLLIAAVLGTLKAGACYVPLDPAWPARESTVLADLDPALVVDERLAEVDLGGYPTHPPDGVNVAEEQIAYVKYTSGREWEAEGRRG